MPEVGRLASCRCGRLKASCHGRPVRVSVCHCLACQKRSGSAFAAQVRYKKENVEFRGRSRPFVRVADSGRLVAYRFCPECGANVAYVTELEPDLVAIPLGAFDDPYFVAPDLSFNERRRQPWLTLGPDIDRRS